MYRSFKWFITVFLLVVSVAAQDLTSKFDSSRMRERVKTLSSDEFQGRGPGTEGGDRAAKFIEQNLRATGVKAANKGSYFQEVGLIGLKADPDTRLLVKGSAGGEESEFKFGDDLVASTEAQIGEVSVNAEIVFMGYGIDAPLYKWNDYKGAVDQYKGKILVILVNDPPATADEPDLFGGKALTYFGRWTYKLEEAARHGAAGVLLVHTNSSAGYGWNVVRASNGGWRYEILREPDDRKPFLKMRAWISEAAATRLLSSAGLDLKELQNQAKHRDFRPVETGLTASIDIKSEVKRISSPNVVGIVEGSDRTLKREFVIFSGHYDHLGIGEPDSAGDRIYNGAYDNASGVAAMLGIAEVLAKTPVKQRPKRSFLFLFTTAEEQGLLGAEYFVSHPLVPLNKTAANINLDGVNFFGKVRDFIPLGADRSSIIAQINDAARERGLELQADPSPEQGLFFRSDHFPFAKVGVPAVNFEHGSGFIEKPTAEAEAFGRDYVAKHYHQPSDEYFEWWDTSAMIQEAEFALAFGIKIANAPKMPRYNAADEFSTADKLRFR